jgi:hypothetical protein
MTTVCSVCKEPWDVHLAMIDEEYDEVTVEQCIQALKTRNRGPAGPPGPVGAMGAPGRSMRENDE